jgi:hypothetical protein
VQRLCTTLTTQHCAFLTANTQGKAFQEILAEIDTDFSKKGPTREAALADAVFAADLAKQGFAPTRATAKTATMLRATLRLCNNNGL